MASITRFLGHRSFTRILRAPSLGFQRFLTAICVFSVYLAKNSFAWKVFDGLLQVHLLKLSPLRHLLRQCCQWELDILLQYRSALDGSCRNHRSKFMKSVHHHLSIVFLQEQQARKELQHPLLTPLWTHPHLDQSSRVSLNMCRSQCQI